MLICTQKHANVLIQFSNVLQRI